jgi:hypothetical protein
MNLNFKGLLYLTVASATLAVVVTRMTDMIYDSISGISYRGIVLATIQHIGDAGVTNIDKVVCWQDQCKITIVKDKILMVEDCQYSGSGGEFKCIQVVPK